MITYERNKKLFRLVCAALMAALTTAFFIVMWGRVYNRLTVFPYYFKGFLMLGFMYFVLTVFFTWLLNGTQIGFLHRSSVLLSRMASFLIVNIIFYLVTCLLSTYLVPIWGFALLSVVDILTAGFLTGIFNRLFDRVFPPIEMLLIYGDHRESEIKRMTGMWQGRYSIGRTISISRGRHKCIRAIKDFDAVVICDVPVSDRNVIAEYCQENGILTYFTPSLADMLLSNTQSLRFFDSPPGRGLDFLFGTPLSAAQRFSLIGYLKKIYRGTMETLYERVSEKADRGEKEFIITANPETLMNGLESEEFDRIILSEDTLVIPDGIGLIKALSISGYGRYTKIAGIDFAKLLLRMAEIKGLSLYLYGAAREVIEDMAALVGREYPHIKLLGWADGYEKDPDEVMREAASLAPDIIMVALGVPAQEILIAKHIDEFEKGIFIGVGGSFDVLSGRKKRAPDIFLKYNLEWLYRITKEPVRMKRFFRSNLRFIWEVMKIKSIR